jgi:hypothetical protein
MSVEVALTGKGRSIVNEWGTSAQIPLSQAIQATRAPQMRQ